MWPAHLQRVTTTTVGADIVDDRDIESTPRPRLHKKEFEGYTPSVDDDDL